MSIFERYLETIKGSDEEALHSAGDILKYMDCPMRWCFSKVYKESPRRIVQSKLYNSLMKSFLLDMLMFRSKEFLFLDHICDVWGEYATRSVLYETGDNDLRRMVLVDGAEFLANIFDEIFVPDVAGAAVDCAVYVNPGIQTDGAMSFCVSAIYEDPAKVLLITDRSIPKKAWATDPELYSLAAINKRVQRSMGRVGSKAQRPVFLSIADKKLHTIPDSLDKYEPGPHWARIMECMDIIGVYPRVGTHCKVCPYETICTTDKADIRKMKSAGKSPNANRLPLRARNDRRQKTDDSDMQ